MKHYDLIVLGEEISGMWLLHKLCNKQSRLREKKRKLSSQNILWIRTKSSLPRFNLPSSIADHFGVPVEKRWNMELAFPSKVFLWDQKKIESYLSSAGLNQKEWLTEDNKITRVCQYLQKYHPEFSTISEGIWSYLGYCENVSKETKVWASLLCGEIAEWDFSNVPVLPGVEVLTWDSSHRIKLLQPNRKQVELEFGTGEKVSTTRLYLNTELSNLQTVLFQENFQKLGFDENIFSPLAKYSLHLEFEENTYLPFQKSILLFSTDGIPDAKGEIAFVDREKNTKIQIGGRRNDSLFAILERFKLTVRDLARGYTELPVKVKSYYPPLGMESCYSDDSRSRVLQELQESRRDVYRLTRTSPQTAFSTVKNISPSVNCHLPYPMGPLTETSKLFSEYA